MNDIDPRVSVLVTEILGDLRGPVSPSEDADGWTVQSKQATQKYFLELQEAFSHGRELPPLGITRGLDHWGVSSGVLFEKIVDVMYRLTKAGE